MIFYRNIAALMLAGAILQVAIGALNVMLPLAMAGAAWSGPTIGAVAAAYAAGFLAGAWYAPRFIRRVGHIRAFAAAGGIAAAVTLLLGVEMNPPAWALARFAFGACCALLFAVAESWISDATPSERRGAVIAAYQILGRAGIIIGPFLIAMPGLDLTKSFLIAGAFIALALVPVTATRREQPRPPSTVPSSPLKLIRIAPAAAAGVFFAGLINTPVLVFVPIWADTLGGAEGAMIAGAGAAALMMAAAHLTSMASQWPAGRLSDHIDRRLVIAGLSGAAAVVMLILAAIAAPGLWLGAVLIGLWGAGSLAHYGVAIAHAADRASKDDLPSMVSTLLMVWGAGSVIGPLLAGAIYASPLGVRGVFLYAGILGLALAGGMLLRHRMRAAPPPETREEFVNLHATSAALVEPDDETDRESEPFAGDDRPA